MTDRYARIRRALAMGPTPGPWAWSHNIAASSDVIHCIEVTAKDRTGSVAYMLSYTADDYDDRAETIANARLIAACDPDTIRALLAERDALAAKVASYERAERDINEALNMGNGSYLP